MVTVLLLNVHPYISTGHSQHLYIYITLDFIILRGSIVIPLENEPIQPLNGYEAVHKADHQAVSVATCDEKR